MPPLKDLVRAQMVKIRLQPRRAARTLVGWLWRHTIARWIIRVLCWVIVCSAAFMLAAVGSFITDSIHGVPLLLGLVLLVGFGRKSPFIELTIVSLLVCSLFDLNPVLGLVIFGIIYACSLKAKITPSAGAKP